MKYKETIFLIIRYSVLTNGVKLSRDVSLDEYKEKLFNPSRLKNRSEIFKNITLKSIESQKDCPCYVKLLICVSREMPVNFKLDLYESLRNIEFKNNFSFDVVELDASDSLTNKITKYIKGYVAGKGEHKFATVRLDDDDGLSSLFCLKLYQYIKNDIIGVPISFPYGYEGFYDLGKKCFFDIRHWYYPKIALGLAFINKYTEEKGFLDQKVSVYHLGSHTKIDVNYPVLLDSRFPAYFRTLSTYNDSGGNVHHQNLVKVESSNFCFEEFPYIDNVRDLTKRSAESLQVPVETVQRFSTDNAKLKSEISKYKKLIQNI